MKKAKETLLRNVRRLKLFKKYKSPDCPISKSNYNRLLLIVIIFHDFMLGAVGLISNPLKEFNEFSCLRIISFVIIFVVGSLFIIIAWIKPQANRALLIITSLVSFFWIMETFKMMNRRMMNETLQFILGVNKELIALSLILARISWKISSAFQILINLLCILRYTDFMSSEMKIYPIFHFISETFLLGLCAYLMERYDEEDFKKLRKYKYTLSCFKNLIIKFFPSAVLIVKDEKILFYNEKTLNILECEEEAQVLSKLDGLQLDESYLSTEKRHKQNFVRSEDFKPMLSENYNESSIRLPQILKYKSSHPRKYCCKLELNNKQKHLEINLTKIIWEDEIALMIIISENEYLEKIKLINEQSEYKDKLLATVSHDLRTPLNGIMGMIRTTIEISEDLRSIKYLNIALRSSQLLHLVINDILDYSQITNGRLRLNFETFCLWSIIKDTTKLFKFQAKMKGLLLHKENLAGKLKGSTNIKSDQNRIKQVLFNLLGNALKFTNEGSIKITLKPWKQKEFSNSSCELITEPEKAFMICVEDTGIGIKKEDQKNLFKLWGKIENEDATATTFGKNGVGLGLAISQSLVKVLNKGRRDGEIAVVSEYRKGSSFSFIIYSEEDFEIKGELFPRGIEEKSDQEMKYFINTIERNISNQLNANPLKNKNEEKIKKKKKILVVDDDQINILVISSYLKSFENYEYEVAFDGEEAIKKIKIKAQQSYFFDLILMDCNMPNMNGSEAVLIIDQMIELREIPSLAIIICTANASINDSDFRFLNGSIDHITKPFSKEQIKQKIEKY